MWSRWCRSELLLCKAPEVIRDGSRHAAHSCIADHLPSEASADLVHGEIGARQRETFARAGAKTIIGKLERQFELQEGGTQVRRRDRHKGDCLLLGVIDQYAANQLDGNLG